MMKINNIISNKGNSIANQFEIYDGRKTYFQSYGSIIVMIDRKDNKTYLDERYWDYSVTTGKYRNMFLREKKAETQKKIDSGVYILTNLN